MTDDERINSGRDWSQEVRGVVAMQALYSDQDMEAVFKILEDDIDGKLEDGTNSIPSYLIVIGYERDTYKLKHVNIIFGGSMPPPEVRQEAFRSLGAKVTSAENVVPVCLYMASEAWSVRRPEMPEGRISEQPDRVEVVILNAMRADRAHRATAWVMYPRPDDEVNFLVMEKADWGDDPEQGHEVENNLLNAFYEGYVEGNPPVEYPPMAD